MMAITSSFSDFDIFLSVYLLEALIDENIPLAALKTRVCIPDENALTFFRIIFFKRKPAPNGGFIPFPCTAKFICFGFSFKNTCYSQAGFLIRLSEWLHFRLILFISLFHLLGVFSRLFFILISFSVV